ncbi:MAG: lipoate--protein ligase family protein [Candidatus Aquicultorales bacterium]
MSKETSVWRLIIGPDCNAAENMAIDEAIFESRRRGLSLSTVRIYEWAQPGVTLGRYELSTILDPDACRELGLTVIRRPTGGGIMVHSGDLSVCVAAETRDGIGRSATFLSRVAQEEETPFLLEGHEKWIDRYLFFQGTLASGVHTEILDAISGRFFLTDPPGKEERTGEKLERKAAEKTFAALLRKKLGVRFITGTLSDYELALAGDLIPKYSDERWTYRDTQQYEPGDLLAG